MKIEKYLKASPIFTLYKSSETVIQDFNNRMKREDLNLLQALILLALFFEESDVQPSHLATLFSTTRGNISHCLTALEKRKLVARNVNHKDARQYFISITSMGKKKTLRLIKQFDAIQNHFESRLGEDMIMNYNQSIQKLAEVYNQFHILNPNREHRHG